MMCSFSGDVENGTCAVCAVRYGDDTKRKDVLGSNACLHTKCHFYMSSTCRQPNHHSTSISGSVIHLLSFTTISTYHLYFICLAPSLLHIKLHHQFIPVSLSLIKQHYNSEMSYTTSLPRREFTNNV